MSNKTQRAEVKSALEALAAGNNGKVNPRDVLAEAKSDTSPLHRYFTWEDSKAGERYRLQEARALLQRYRIRIVEGEKTSVRAFVSLTDERGKDGGYRPLMQVLGMEERREQMLADALEELQRFEAKYQMLSELEPLLLTLPGIRRRIRSSLGKEDRASA